MGTSHPTPVAPRTNKSSAKPAVAAEFAEAPQPEKKRGLLSRIFGRDKKDDNKHEVYREEGGHAAVMVTMNNAGTVSAQPGGGFHKRSVKEKTENGVTVAEDRRVSIDSPNVRSNRSATLLDRDNPRDRVTGMHSGSDQKNFNQEIVYQKSGNVVRGTVEGTTHLSGRKNAGKYEIATTSTETTAANGDRYYKDEGKGFFKKLFSREKEVTIDGQGFRAADPKQKGGLARDVFVMTNAETGEVIKAKETQLQRYEMKNGKVVTLFTDELKGKNGKNETRYFHEVTQDPRDPSKFTFKRADDALLFHLREAGKGSIQFDKEGDLVVKEKGGRVVAGVTVAASAAVNAGVFSKKTEQDLELIRSKTGGVELVSYGSKQTEGAVGIGAAIGPAGGGVFGFLGGQKNKTTDTKAQTDAYTAKLITKNGRFGEQIARIQAVLQVTIDGEAAWKGETHKALDAYFANGGSIKDLEAAAAKAKNHPAVLAIAPALRAETETHMIARKDMPLYNGSDISINGHTYSAEQVRKAQEKSVDKIDGFADNKPIPRNLTTVMIADGKNLRGVDINELGTYGYQIAKGADSVIIAVDKNNVHLDPARGHMVGVTITTIEDNKFGKTTTTTIQTEVSSLPGILHAPVILRGEKDKPTRPRDEREPPPKTPKPRPRTPEQPPVDPEIPTIPTGDCPGCPKPAVPPVPSTPKIPVVTPDGCVGCPIQPTNTPNVVNAIKSLFK